MNRRKFIETIGRNTILGALATIGGILMYNNRIDFSNKCTNKYMCKKCGQLSECELPEAIEYSTMQNKK